MEQSGAGNRRIEQNWMEYSKRMEGAEQENGRMEWREENRAVDGAEQNGTEEVV